MNAPYISTSSSHIARRTFLRGLGVLLGLPALECMTPVFARTAESAAPRRLLIMANNLGLLRGNFFPQDDGPDYTPSPYLELLGDQRKEFTVFSGLSHPGVTGGHSTDGCFLTAAPGAYKPGFRNSISLDQFAAEKLPQLTRFPTLNLGVISDFEKGKRGLSFTRDGALLPTENSPSALYKKMFIQGNPAEVQERLHRLQKRGSILDTLTREAGRFNRNLGSADKDRLDQYLTSVREVEQRLETAGEWEQRPKPAATQPSPTDIREDKLFFEKLRLMLDMTQLAFETDSTRIVTFMVDAFRAPVFRLPDQTDTTYTYHLLSHHGQDEEKLRQLEAADREHLTQLRQFIGNLAARSEDDRRLLDHTMVLYGSNLGNANIHDCTNLPILMAGGGFRHGRHLAFKQPHNTPLCNLYVTLLQSLGVETHAFSSSAGNLNQISA